MKPAAFLGMAPLIALPLAAALPAGLRDQVMHAVFGSSPAAVAHRAALGQTPYSFGPNGFPQPLHPLRPPWWQQHAVHYSTAAGTAAAIAAGVTIAVVPPHLHPGGHQPGAGPSAVASGTGPAAAGTRPPAARTPGAAGMPRASVVATMGASVTPGVGTPGVGTPGAGTPGAGTPGAGPPGPSPVAAGTPASATASATASASATTAGTLNASPATLDITSPGSGTITLTAAGGPVDWSVSEPPGMEKKVVVTPMSGTLTAGATATITVTVNGSGKPTVHLTFSPGGAVVTINLS